MIAHVIRPFGLASAFVAILISAHGQPSRALSPDHVTFFTEPNFKGEKLVVEAGASLDTLDRMVRTLTQKPWTFAISSVRVAGAARATVYSGAGYSGDRLEITRSISDLYAEPRGREPGATWDRAIASLGVTGPPRSALTTPAPAVRREQPVPRTLPSGTGRRSH